MIIDLILDRMHGKRYNAREFYYDVMEYEEIFNFEPHISEAMDYGEEYDVQRALCRYIKENEYNEALYEYVTSVEWLVDEED